MVDVEDTPPISPKTRTMDVRIVYTLLPNRKISSDENLFEEEYIDEYAKSSTHWYGPNNESIHGDGRVYFVNFDAAPFEVRTISTGCRFGYELPLRTDRKAFGRTMSVPSSQDFFIYPNKIDFISELTIIISSETLDLTPDGQSARVTDQFGIVHYKEPRINPASGILDGATRSISAQWENIKPNEEAGIVFNCKPKGP